MNETGKKNKNNWIYQSNVFLEWFNTNISASNELKERERKKEEKWGEECVHTLEAMMMRRRFFMWRLFSSFLFFAPWFAIFFFFFFFSFCQCVWGEFNWLCVWIKTLNREKLVTIPRNDGMNLKRVFSSRGKCSYQSKNSLINCAVGKKEVRKVGLIFWFPQFSFLSTIFTNPMFIIIWTNFKIYINYKW